MAKTVQDFLASAPTELAAYDAKGALFRTEIDENQKRVTELTTRLTEVLATIGRPLLPAPDPANVAAFATSISDDELPRLFANHDQEVRMATDRLAEIDAMPAYQLREARGPELQALLADNDPLHEQMQREMQRLDSYEHMRTLAYNGYGTPEYRFKGWRKYLNKEALQDWKFADRIAEAEQVADVTTVVQRYRTLGDQLALHQKELQRGQSELAALNALIEERARIATNLADAPDRWAAVMGDRVATAALDRGLATNVDPTALTTVSGIRHQVTYLTQIREQLETDLNDLNVRASKMKQEASNYSYNTHKFRNKQFTDEAFAKRFGRADTYERRLERYQRAGVTVYSFNSYDRGSYMGDVLWWDIMTDGRMNGSFIPDVVTYRDRHPTYIYTRSHYGSSHSDSSHFSSQDRIDDNQDNDQDLDPIDRDAS
jgi:hypothetical protein